MSRNVGPTASPISAAVRIGNATSTSTDVTRIAQVKIGSRHIVMPGARMQITVVIMLTPPRMVPRPETARPMIHRSPPTPRRVLDAGQRRVGGPAEGGRAVRGEEAGGGDDGAEEVQPVGEGVQPRERDVRRADLQRQHEVGEPEHDGRRIEQQHDRAVHGEQLVVLLGRRGTACPAGPARPA